MGRDPEDMVDVAAQKLCWEVRELSLGSHGEIQRLSGPPSPLQFLRDFVMPSKPCIISHAIDHWPALRSWSNAYLRSALAHHFVSVHFSPDGFADAVVDLDRLSTIHGCSVSDPVHDCRTPSSQFVPLPEETAVSNDVARESLLLEDRHNERSEEPRQRCNLWFATAHVERLPFPIALDMILRSGTECGEVAYAQQQNGCFLTEYSVLVADAEAHLPWATEALGCMPEAVNLWIGNDRAVTSFHKDHYENLYAVVAGEKHFTLLPPTDVHRLYMRPYPSARYIRHDGRFTIERLRPHVSVPWVSVDPYPTSERKSVACSAFPQYFEGPEPFTCSLQAGEILYLPSMWFHHVRQSPDSEGRTIALNFWYDMQFDIKYAYYNFLESLIQRT